MAGFKGKRKPSKNFESELDAVMQEEETLDDNYGMYDSYDYDEDDDDVVMEYKPRQEKRKEQQETKQKPKESSKEKSTSSKNSKMIGVGLVVGLVVVLILVGVSVFGGNKEEEDKPGINGQTVKKQEDMVSGENAELPSVDGNTSSNPMLSGNSNSNNTNSSETKPTSGVSMEDSSNTINPGLPDPAKGKQNTNNGAIEDTSGFIMDINGNKIPQNYTAKKIVTETDFISYVKKRGITADGIELLWLDAEYKGQPYTVQVPFRIWKELDSQGITVVEMEVLYLENDAKVISYMKVKENYKEIMEKGEAALNK